MPFFLGLLFWLGVIATGRHAYRHLKGEFTKSRGKAVKSAEAKHGGSLSPSQRWGERTRHGVSWWTREAGAGFPVIRTGFHTGWLAHRTAATQAEARREEARVEHLRERHAFGKELPRYRKERADLEAEIAEAVAENPPERPTLAAVRERASAVVLPFRNRDGSQPAAGEARDPYAPAALAGEGDWEDLVGGEKPALGPYAEPGDSFWRNPAEPPCGTCGGTGADPEHGELPGVAGSCRECRGWGDGPGDPDAPEAPAGTPCSACGRPGTDEDPVLAGVGGSNIHRSHITEDINRRHGAIDDAVIAADQEPIPPTGQPATGGTHMSAEMGYRAHVAAAQQAAASSEQWATEFRAMARSVEAQADDMSGAEMDSATLAEAMDLREKYLIAAAAAEACMEGSTQFAGSLQQRHEGLASAHEDAPVDHAAHRSFYENA